jgi:DNA-binding XRE family transcriptional regulator
LPGLSDPHEKLLTALLVRLGYRNGEPGRAEMQLSGRQLKAARVLAGCSQEQLAEEAGILRETLIRIESSGLEPVISRDQTVALVLAALGRHNVMLVPNGCVMVS